MQTVGFSRRVRAVRRAVVTTALALVAAGSAAAQTPCTPPLDACLDDFTCYLTLLSKGTTPFTPVDSVTLTDQFESMTGTVHKPLDICAPTDKNAEGTLDEDTHLSVYKLARLTPRHIQRTALRVTNSLEEIRVDTLRVDSLLVPSAKSLTQPFPPAPDPGGHDLDLYKCYKVRVTPGTPLAAQNRKVTAGDQFTSPPRIVTLRKPRHLCVPVSVNGSVVKSPDAHLLCYNAKPARGEPKHIRRSGLFLSDQFGNMRLDTIREREFCIPTTTTP
jgi:hypothetical protein